MYAKSLFRQALTFCKYRNSKKEFVNSVRRGLHLSQISFKNEDSSKKEVAPLGHFEKLENKNKNSYLEMIKVFVNRDTVHRRGHVEFIYAALKNMESYGVQKDLEVYKALVDVLPKGKLIPQNIFQAEFMHYPKQQQCIIDLLEQMEDNGVLPDREMEDMLLNIFGKRGYPLRKLWRMMYWMPKFKNQSPWPIPDPVPQDTLELAKLAIARISSVDVQAKLTVYQTSDIKDSIEDTWIVSSQSPKQKELLAAANIKEPIYIEGSFRVWIRNKLVNYFVLRGSPNPFKVKYDDPDDVTSIEVPLFSFTPPKKEIAIYPSVHEQEDGTIYAVCATGTSGKDSLLSWIRHLEKDGNPILATIPIVFTLKSGETEVTTTSAQAEENKEPKNITDG